MSSSYQEADIHINYILFSNDVNTLNDTQILVIPRHYYSWLHWRATWDHSRIQVFYPSALDWSTDSTQQALPRNRLTPTYIISFWSSATDPNSDSWSRCHATSSTTAECPVKIAFASTILPSFGPALISHKHTVCKEESYSIVTLTLTVLSFK